MSIMTVGDLRKALEGIDDNLEIIVYSTEEHMPPDGDIETCCILTSAELSRDCDDNLFFALHADNSDEYEGEDEEEGEDEDEDDESA